MKKLFLGAALLLASATGFAQTEKGKLMVGASSDLNFTSMSYDEADTTTNTFEVSPQVGYFVADNITVGLNASYSNTNPEGDDNSTNVVGVGPFARVYFLEDEKVRPYAQAAYLYKSTKTGDADAMNANEIGLTGGAAYFITDSVSIDAALNYGLGMSNDMDDYSKINFGVGFNLFF